VLVWVLAYGVLIGGTYGLGEINTLTAAHGVDLPENIKTWGQVLIFGGFALWIIGLKFMIEDFRGKQFEKDAIDYDR
jgi:hypothetical protein